MQKKVKIIGGGLAGAEAAYYLARKGVKVELYDIKPIKKTPAHTSNNYAELVCSNSLKSNDVYGNAAGLLKEELRLLGSLTIEAADNTKVPAGNALAVDREKFSAYVTEKLRAEQNITHISQEVQDVDTTEYTIVASGPLTTDKLSKNLSKLVGGGLSFFDASAPIIDFESIDSSSSSVNTSLPKNEIKASEISFEKTRLQTRSSFPFPRGTPPNIFQACRD